MANEGKLTKLIKTKRNVGEGEDWIFSLIPIAIAFVFYCIFILNSDIEQKGDFIAYGAAAGLIGLESYWIIRGWRLHHLSTIIMGLLGIAITVGFLSLYLSLS